MQTAPTDHWINDLVNWLGLGTWATQALAVSVLLAACALCAALSRFVAFALVRRAIRRTQFRWDDAFVDHGFLRWLSWVPAALVAQSVAAALPQIEGVTLDVIDRTASAFLVFACMMTLSALLTALHAIYQELEVARSRPLKGYVQIGKILVHVIGTVVLISAVMREDPWQMLTGIGAMTAVLLLIFKDTILSLVASIQLSSTDMVRVGDWVELPQFGADGDVIDISLHTVKIQNWDKTITTVPTYSLVSGSFKNWRGMQESGGRRIKRSLHVDVASVRFLDEDDVERFSQFRLLQGYIAGKRAALAESAQNQGEAAEIPANKRRLTNLGTFRAYIIAYLRNHPEVHPYMTFLVRQLEPGPQGVPLEIYVFSKVTRWVDYEAIQADIFDHLLAIAPEFELRVFQSPSSGDLAALAREQPA